MKIIFDTNAAREYIARVPYTNIEEYAKTNAKKMKNNGIDLLVNPIVIMELMYHLLDKNDKDYYVSYNTIKALVLTMECQYKNASYPMMAVAECIIARDLFDERIEKREEMYSNLMSGASHIAHKSIDDINDFVSTDGTVIKEYIDSVESSFVDQTKMLIKKLSVNFPNIKFEDILKSDHLEQSLAMYIIRTTYGLLINEDKIDPKLKIFLQAITNAQMPMSLYLHEVEIEELFKKIQKHAQTIAKKYPSFIALFKQVLIKIKGGMSNENIKNYIWDILLMFNVTNLTMNKESVVFVTTDKAMLEAADISHKNLYIMTFKELKEKYLQ